MYPLFDFFLDELSLSLSPKAMAELKDQIEKERLKLRMDKTMVIGERNQTQAELAKKEKELKKAQYVQCTCI